MTGGYSPRKNDSRWINAKPAGREGIYRGYSVDRFRYPEDPRLHLWSAGAWVRRIDRHPFLFVNDMNGEYLQVYRLPGDESGEIAAPSGLFAKRHINQQDWPPYQPEKGNGLARLEWERNVRCWRIRCQ